MGGVVTRIERLINLIAALLDAPRPMTAEQIRRGIAGYDQPDKENFRRSFERDKKELRELGIPIETVEMGEWGDEPEGYTIPKDKYYMPELDLADDELAALRIVADVVLGSGEQAAVGFRKLSASAETSAWNAPHLVWGADVAAEQPNLSPLFAALVERVPVGFAYVSGDGSTSQRTVEPYTLVHRRGHWYLVGRDIDRDATRSFKVSRIDRMERGEGSYDIPADFDASAHTGMESWEIGEEVPIPVTLRFAPGFSWWAEQNMTFAARTKSPDGSVEVSLDVAKLDALISWVLGFVPQVEIVEPEEARARLVEHLAPYLGGER
jgi:predicted DNA-binding transcriptional regulator YafY